GRRRAAAPRERVSAAPSGQRCLTFRAALESFEAPRRGTWHAGRLDRLRSDDQQREPTPALLVRGHAVGALEDDLLDAAVGGNLDGVPDRKPVLANDVVALVDAAVDREPHGFRLGCRPQ